MPRVAIREFTTANPIYAGCTAEFWTVSAGVKTATHADLYRGATGSSKHANPITLDSRGMSSGPIYIETETICTVGGLNVSDHDTGIITPGPSFRVDQTTGKFQYSFDAGSSWNDSGDYIFKHRGTWLTGTAYNRNDTALSGGNLYLCLEGHTSGVFATDLAASKWLLFLDLSANVVITSATEPAAMFAHMLWADTTNDLLKIRNAGNTAWVSLFILSTGAAVSPWARKWVASRYYSMQRTGVAAGGTPDCDSVVKIVTTNTMFFVPVFVPYSISIAALAVRTLYGSHTPRNVRMGLYSVDDATGKPYQLVKTCTPFTTSGTQATQEGALGETVAAGWYWAAILTDGNLTVIGFANETNFDISGSTYHFGAGIGGVNQLFGQNSFPYGDWGSEYVFCCYSYTATYAGGLPATLTLGSLSTVSNSHPAIVLKT